MSDHERQSRERGPFAGCLAIALFFGLPAYLLSAGPAHWLIRNGYLPPQTGLVYFPLFPLVEHLEPFGRIFMWYLKQWE